MDTNTLQVVEQFGAKIDSYFNVLAAKVGVAADHFYSIFVQQQKIEAISEIVFCLLATVIAIFLLKMGLKNIKNADDGDSIAMAKSVIGLIGGGVMALFLMIAPINDGPKVVGKLVNPEYYAVQSLINGTK